jgi:hypothetical protein
MHRWIAITLFPSQDIRCVRNDELKLHYAIVKKIKVVPVKEMFNHWLETFKVSTSISCTSLVTCIATNIGALEGKDVVYISTPRIINDEHYLMQGHHLKYNAAGDLVFYVPRYTNEIRLPNPQLHLYKSYELTFDLKTQGARRSSVSGRMTQSRARNEAASSSQQQPPHSPVVKHPMYHAGWAPAGYVPGFIPGYNCWDQPSQQHEAGGSGWQSMDSTEWELGRQWQPDHSSDSEGLPPPVMPRQSVSDSRELDTINTRIRGLEIRTGEIQNMLNTHLPDTTQWHQQQQQQWQQQHHQQMMQLNALLKQQHDQMMGYWQHLGHNSGP